MLLFGRVFLLNKNCLTRGSSRGVASICPESVSHSMSPSKQGRRAAAGAAPSLSGESIAASSSPPTQKTTLLDSYWQSGLITHRWLRVLIYGVAVSLTSCLFSGWQQYSLILLKGRMYEWVCDESELRPYPELPELVTCKAQEQRVAALFPVASGCELVGAIVAGFTLDRLGPRASAFFGCLTGFASYLMLGFSTGSHDMLIPSMVINGAAINMIAFPALILEDYFPTVAATCAAFVISCQCLSSIVAPGLWLLWQHVATSWSFRELWMFYVGTMFVPCSLLFLLALPLRRETKKIAALVRPDESAEEAYLVEEAAMKGAELEALKKDVETLSVRNDATANEIELLFAQRRAEPSSPSRLSDRNSERLPHLRASESYLGTVEEKGFSLKTLLYYCATPQFILINFVGMILMLQNAYYQLIVRDEFGVDVSNYLGYTMPVQALWGLMLGRLCDVIKTPMITSGLLGTFSLMYFLVFAGRSNIQYFSATLFNIAMSYAFTIKYSYCQETFSAKYYGTLVGISGCLGGVAVFATALLTAYGSVALWSTVLGIAGVACIPLALGLEWDARRRTPRGLVLPPETLKSKLKDSLMEHHHLAAGGEELASSCAAIDVEQPPYPTSGASGKPASDRERRGEAQVLTA